MYAFKEARQNLNNNNFLKDEEEKGWLALAYSTAPAVQHTVQQVIRKVWESFRQEKKRRREKKKKKSIEQNYLQYRIDVLLLWPVKIIIKMIESI